MFLQKLFYAKSILLDIINPNYPKSTYNKLFKWYSLIYQFQFRFDIPSQNIKLLVLKWLFASIK